MNDLKTYFVSLVGAPKRIVQFEKDREFRDSVDVVKAILELLQKEGYFSNGIEKMPMLELFDSNLESLGVFSTHAYLQPVFYCKKVQDEESYRERVRGKC